MVGIDHDLRAGCEIVGAIVKPAGTARIARKASSATVSSRMGRIISRGVPEVGANPLDVILEAQCIGTVLDHGLQGY